MPRGIDKKAALRELIQQLTDKALGTPHKDKKNAREGIHMGRHGRFSLLVCIEADPELKWPTWHVGISRASAGGNPLPIEAHKDKADAAKLGRKMLAAVGKGEIEVTVAKGRVHVWRPCSGQEKESIGFGVVVHPQASRE